MADARACIRALRNSQDDLSALVKCWMDSALLQGPAYDRQWAIAQVLSHLGSGAEIFSLLLDAASGASEPPSHETLRERWKIWDAKEPRAQADDFIATNRRLIERLNGLASIDLARLRLAMFGRDLDAAGLLHLRLREHALRRWDVTVMHHERAELLDDAVALLVDGLADAGRQAASGAGQNDRPHHPPDARIRAHAKTGACGRRSAGRPSGARARVDGRQADSPRLRAPRSSPSPLDRHRRPQPRTARRAFTSF